MQVCLENFKYLGCKNTDLKTVLYCQKCLMGVYEVQKPQNFPGATPPDSCRSSLGAAMRHLGRAPLSQGNGSLRSPQLDMGIFKSCYLGKITFWNVRVTFSSPGSSTTSLHTSGLCKSSATRGMFPPTFGNFPKLGGMNFDQIMPKSNVNFILKIY